MAGWALVERGRPGGSRRQLATGGRRLPCRQACLRPRTWLARLSTAAYSSDRSISERLEERRGAAATRGRRACRGKQRAGASGPCKAPAGGGGSGCRRPRIHTARALGKHSAGPSVCQLVEGSGRRGATRVRAVGTEGAPGLPTRACSSRPPPSHLLASAAGGTSHAGGGGASQLHISDRRGRKGDPGPSCSVQTVHRDS